MTNDLTYLKIKVALAKLNINEKYIGCEYLARILLDMMNNEKADCYASAINMISAEFNIAKSSAKMSISSVLKNSKFFEIFPTLSNISTNKKLNALKNYIGEQLA